MSHENQWLEDAFPSQIVPFYGDIWVFGGVPFQTCWCSGFRGGLENIWLRESHWKKIRRFLITKKMVARIILTTQRQYITHRIHVWYIYLHLILQKSSKCGQIYQSHGCYGLYSWHAFPPRVPELFNIFFEIPGGFNLVTQLSLLWLVNIPPLLYPQF